MHDQPPYMSVGPKTQIKLKMKFVLNMLFHQIKIFFDKSEEGLYKYFINNNQILISISFCYPRYNFDLQK